MALSVHVVWSAGVEAGSESSAVCSWHVGRRAKQQWSTSLTASYSRRPALKNWLEICRWGLSSGTVDLWIMIHELQSAC